MSQSPTAAAHPAPWTQDDRPTVAESRDEVQALLDVIDDPDCRTVLEATSTDAYSATELADDCDVPLSTLYRKLDRLADAGLLEENLRIRRSGKHVTEYTRRVDAVTVSVATDGGFRVEVA